VEDNGEGIDDQIKNSIYDLFFRGSAKSKGSGLGLFIARRAVEKLNGEIYCSSIPGTRTTFTICLRNIVLKVKSREKGLP
jgi:signal transduction histidine kinase